MILLCFQMNGRTVQQEHQMFLQFAEKCAHWQIGQSPNHSVLKFVLLFLSRTLQALLQQQDLDKQPTKDLRANLHNVKRFNIGYFHGNCYCVKSQFYAICIFLKMHKLFITSQVQHSYVVQVQMQLHKCFILSTAFG